MAEIGRVFLAHTGGAEPPQRLEEHLRQVSALAGAYAAKIGAEAAGSAIGLLHDIGKYSAAFQEYLKRMQLGEDTEGSGSERGTIDHSTAGAQAIWSVLKNRSDGDGVIGEILALCIASHHSGLIDCITPDGTNNLIRRMRKEDSSTHYQEAWSNAETEVVRQHERNMRRPDLAEGLADKIRSICRIDSDEELRRFKIGLLTRLLFSCLIDADRTDTADSSNPTASEFRQRGRYIEWTILGERLEAELAAMASASPMDELRRSVSEACSLASERPQGIFTLTVPTGGGKTLASLRFAIQHAQRWGLDRIIFVSPFTSIIDQNAEAARKILEPAGEEFGSVVLEHHSNLTPLKQTWKSKVLTENWDAPVVYTTAVQVLEALFGSGTRGVRRMHQMSKAVLVFDEIQTLPIRCVHLFNNAMNFLVEQCGSTVVLCTATQPLLHRVDERKGAIRLGNKPEIISGAAALFQRVKRYEAFDCRKPGGWEHPEAAELALTEARKTGSCLVVVNTKKEARSVFRECQTRIRDEEAAHLSTSMCPAHRMDVLNGIKERLRSGGATICVSTQLIEAGVDISFGAVVRALAGIDSIAQAAGRCNRHGEQAMGRVFVINLAGDVPMQLADIRAAQEAAQRVLDERGAGGRRAVNLEDLEVIERYYEYYFFDRRKEMDYPVDARAAGRDDTLLNMLATNRLASAGSAGPPTFMRQAFMSAAGAFQAIDASTLGVLVPYTETGKQIVTDLCSAYEPKKQWRLLRAAQRYTVNVFPPVLRRLQEAAAVHEAQEGTGIFYLEGRHYNASFGLDIEGTGEMEFHDA